MPPWLTRRACLALALGAALPRPARAQAPGRVVCLEWTAAETVLALGLAPVAIGDVGGYRDWVVAPPLPEATQDLGSRFEPNRELLRELAPDLVVVTEGYGVTAADLGPAVPTFTISPFTEGVAPLDHACREAERLADRLGRAQDGRRLTADFATALAEGRARLAAEASAPVCVVSIFEERTARVYGGAGLIGDTMARLGLRNAFTGEVGSWGFAQVGLEQFARLPPDVRLVILDPVPDPVRIRLEENSLWNGLPPIRDGRMVRIPPVWPFGGPAAATRLARLLCDALRP